MNTLMLLPEQEQEIQSFNPTIQRMWSIDVNADTVQEAGELVRLGTDQLKKFDEMRLQKTRPLDALKKDWMNFFEQLKAQPEKATFALKAKLTKYMREETEKAQKAEHEAFLKAKEEADKLAKQADFLDKMGDLSSAVATRNESEKVLQEDFTQKTDKVAGINTRKVHKYRITSEFDVPREYLCIDEKKLGELARTSKGTASVAGVEFYSEDVLAVRGY